ncbi:MAG: Unknown protein [uncultured Thiotrichaceae bacterium]|uniref:Toprim domain-containing protein n=1 Tax=uncultured Thiotrichaceae bacterium TaxID=298394 RepID=A0A6S6TK83_9GAMM|nr:MAG: Unknown protein [uncultured Thiotrichaceae bacterium]
MAYKYDKGQVQGNASGRWFEIFQALDTRLSKAASNAGGHVPCPAGIGGSDSFRFEISSNTDGHAFSNQADNRKLSDGFGVLIWLNGWSFPDTLKRVADYLDDNRGRVSTQPTTTTPDTEGWKRKAVALKRMLDRAASVPNESVRAYYYNRGLELAAGIASPSLWYHKGVSISYRGQTIKDGGSWVTVPAIIGRMSGSQGWTGAQIIRLTKDGYKASEFMRDAIEQATGTRPEQVSDKQLLKTVPNMSGSAVRLGKAESTLCVGEGLETMLAVALALDTRSVASAGTAVLLERLEIPPQVNRLLIFADKDRTERGLQAAEVLRDRVKDQMEVKILLPPSPVPGDAKGIDWLDDIKNLGSWKTCVD